MSDYRGLIVDFGGVLTTPLQDSMVAFATEIGLDLQAFVRVALAAYAGGSDPLVVDFETGRMPEGEFAVEFAGRIKEVSGIDVEPKGLVARIFAGLSLEEEMFTAVAAVRSAGLVTALCSNSWGDELYPRDRFAGLFDAVVISGEVGIRKPDPRIFELTLERAGLDAQASIFVDDHPGHLQTASDLGMATVLHKEPRSTITELEDLLGIELGGRTSGSS